MNENTQDVSQGEEVYMSWRSPEYRHVKRPFIWYVIMSVILLLFVAWGVYTGAYVVSITFILLGGVYFFMQKGDPAMLRVEISDVGIRFGKDLYKYSEIRSFWIYFEPPQLTELGFLSKKTVMSQVTIQLPLNMPIAKLRDYLISQVPEQAEREQTITESLIRNLGL